MQKLVICSLSQQQQLDYKDNSGTQTVNTMNDAVQLSIIIWSIIQHNKRKTSM